MKNLEKELDATINLISKEYQRLQKCDEKNELLKYLSKVSSGEIECSCEEDILDEFFNKYAPKENDSVITLFNNYHSALKDAADKIENY